MSERLTLPVLPLRDTVIFPGVAVPISAGRPGTIEAIQKALEGNHDMFAVCQRENVDEVKPDVLHQVGTIVRLVQVQRTRGGVQLLIQGQARALALSYAPAGQAMLEAVVRPLVEQQPLDDKNEAFVALDRELRDRAAELGRRRGIPPDALAQLVQGVESSGAFADLVAFYLDVPAQQKQVFLEMTDIEERMRKVLVAVERELLRLEMQEEIQQRVQEELGEKQREMVLREQMKQIQKELGEDDQASELEELRQRLEALELPEEARKEVEREFHRLERTHPQSAEYQVLRSYLDWICELPWNTRTEDRIDLAEAEQVLEEDHYGLEDVKDRVLEFLAVRKLQMEKAAAEAAAAAASPGSEAGAPGSGATPLGSEEQEAGTPEPAAAQPAAAEAEAGAPEAQAPSSAAEPGGGEAASEPGTAEGRAEAGEAAAEPGEAGKAAARSRAVGRGPILLFVGPPGVGKTSIAKSIARALGRKYVRIALGGVRDEADIRGHRRTYVGAMPGRIIQGLRQAGTKNPVFLLDEVDKLGVSLQGDPAAALLEVLDPAQNHAFVDHYLVQGNIAYNGGTFLIGGGRPSHDIRVLENFFYNVNLQLGYSAPFNEDCEVRNNILVNGSLAINRFRQVIQEGNLIIPPGAPRPNEPARVVLRRNRYDPTRAHVLVFNWKKNPTVDVSLDGFATPGMIYRFMEPRDVYGRPVLEGRYTGQPVQVPMQGEFGVWVVFVQQP